MVRAGRYPCRRFVILAVPRSGSNLLCALLDSHPDIVCHHELFNITGIKYALSYRDHGEPPTITMAERDRHPLAFLERMWRDHRGKDVVGFKMTRGPAEDVVAHVVRDPGITKLILRRANIIKTLTSFKIATRLDQWEVYDSSRLVRQRPKVEVTVAEIADRERMDEEFYRSIDATLEATGQQALTVYYEHLFTDETRHGILEFLGAPVLLSSLHERSVKQNSRDLRDLIENFDDLADEVRGTSWETLLFETGM